jgi:hypothetical protein
MVLPSFAYPAILPRVPDFVRHIRISAAVTAEIRLFGIMVPES